MPEYEKLLSAQLLEAAIESIDGAYDCAEQLLGADVSQFEAVKSCVFAYFDRDDVFYVNRAGRKLLDLKRPAMESGSVDAPPIFWLENDHPFGNVDRFLIANRQPLRHTRELVTLSWGKTWLEGTKFPILSVTGKPLAILFAGEQLPASGQIRHAAHQYRLTLTGLGKN